MSCANVLNQLRMCTQQPGYGWVVESPNLDLLDSLWLLNRSARLIVAARQLQCLLMVAAMYQLSFLPKQKRVAIIALQRPRNKYPYS